MKMADATSSGPENTHAAKDKVLYYRPSFPNGLPTCCGYFARAPQPFLFAATVALYVRLLGERYNMASENTRFFAGVQPPFENVKEKKLDEDRGPSVPGLRQPCRQS